MQIHQLKPTHKPKARKQIGRGGKKGTYSGRGIKGQSSRSGRKMVPIIRELIKRYPKLKGYRSFSMQDKTVILNLDILNKSANDGDNIDPKILIKKGLVQNLGKKLPKIKILGGGKIDKKLFIEKCEVSKTAKESIEKAGGTIKI